MTTSEQQKIAVGLALAAGAYFLLRKIATDAGSIVTQAPDAVAHVIANTPSYLVNTAVTTVANTGYAVGDAINVPRTDESVCAQDIAAGKTWSASFDCPAGTFLNYLNPF